MSTLFDSEVNIFNSIFHQGKKRNIICFNQKIPSIKIIWKAFQLRFLLFSLLNNTQRRLGYCISLLVFYFKHGKDNHGTFILFNYVANIVATIPKVFFVVSYYMLLCSILHIKYISCMFQTNTLIGNFRIMMNKAFTCLNFHVWKKIKKFI